MQLRNYQEGGVLSVLMLSFLYRLTLNCAICIVGIEGKLAT